MKYLELLKQDKPFDFEKNPIQIEQVLFSKTEKKATVNFVIENILSPEELTKFKATNESILSRFGVNKVILNVFYKNYNLDEAMALKYYEMIISKLSNKEFIYKSFLDLPVSYNDLLYTISVDKSSFILNEYIPTIKEAFKRAYLTMDFKLVINEDIKSLAELQQIQTQNDMASYQNRKEDFKEVEEKKKTLKVARKFKTNYQQAKTSKICEIPTSNESIFTYREMVGEPIFVVEGEIFSISVEKKKVKHLVKMHIFDDTDGIICEKFVDDEEAKTLKQFKAGDIVRVCGKAEYNIYSRDVTLKTDSINYLSKAVNNTVMDTAAVKRVELHVHTKMSPLDGLCTASEFLDIADKWGMKAIAFTDHGGIYSNSEISHTKCKVKPLFGSEFNFIDDEEEYKIAFDDRDIPLRNAKYVVFDIETTGFSQRYDRIIEIAAIKVENGMISDKYETFVNPNMLIPNKIKDLTHIDDDMVKDAPTIDVAIREFVDFCQGSILVAHNASFDVGMIYANLKREGISDISFPVIDTLNLFRAMCNKDVLGDKGTARFGLKYLSKFYKVKQESHHRAIDDTRVTAQCFISVLLDVYAKGINNYNELNNIVDPNIMYKYVIPKHINIISQTQEGFKNSYRFVSDALTVHCAGEGRLLKSVLDKYRKGNLVLSGCSNSHVFEYALNGTYEDMIEAMKYCDIIEVQPPSCYLHLSSEAPDGDFRIKDTIKRIIDGAKSLDKLVVATSDAHYINKEDKKYRDILIATPVIGGGTHNLKGYDVAPDMHLRTTDEMLNEFDFLDKDLAYEIVVTNTNKVADMIDEIRVFPKDMFAPRDDQFKDSLGVPSITEEMRRIVNETVTNYYGTNLHPLIKKRLDREVNSIISNGFSSTYYMAYLLVNESMKNGYMVGSRGSVGSSLAATMMSITEINPLPPHYRCKKCKFVAIKMTEEEKKEYGFRPYEEQFQEILASVDDGYDLPDAVCPCCGEKLTKDGHEIPFETFLGFDGDKVPDIDLNFSGEYQAQAHAFIKKVFGAHASFRAGTIATVAENTAFGYVKKYLEEKNIYKRNCEVDRMASKLNGCRRSTGQHPGGIVVVPNYVDIYDVTPVQYPADNTENEWITTHYDYHSFESNLLKLDCLAHDDPTMIRYFMDYVAKHPEDFPFKDATEIPVDDKEVYKMFCSTDIIGVTQDQIMSKVASFAVPELGTNFVRNMLNDTLPSSFSQLLKISGLSHGTGVWLGNAQDLVLGKTPYGEVSFKDIIGCRDDIMIDMIARGADPLKSFQIMEFIRKGKAKKDPEKWASYSEYMKQYMPEWFTWSCGIIEYLFPKAHATAYVLMALRIAWFKLYSPALFYSGWFTKRAKGWDPNALIKGPDFIRQRIIELNALPGKTAKDEDLIVCLQVALEMTCRGYKFLPIDINESDSFVFEVIDKKDLRIPFVAMPGLGESAAASIKAARDERPFSSKADVLKRTRLNKTLFEEFEKMGVFGSLPEEDPEEEVGLFAFLNE